MGFRSAKRYHSVQHFYSIAYMARAGPDVGCVPGSNALYGRREKF